MDKLLNVELTIYTNFWVGLIMVDLYHGMKKTMVIKIECVFITIFTVNK